MSGVVEEVCNDLAPNGGDGEGGMPSRRYRGRAGTKACNESAADLNLPKDVFGKAAVDRLKNGLSLDDRDIAVLAWLFEKLLTGDTSPRLSLLLGDIFGKAEIVPNLQRIDRLDEMGLVNISKKAVRWRMPQLTSYLDAQVSLTNRFINFLATGSFERIAGEKAYGSGREVLDDIWIWVEMIEALDKKMRGEAGSLSMAELKHLIEGHLKMIRSRMEFAADTIPLVGFFRKEKLSGREKEVVKILISLRYFRNEDGVSPEKICDLLGRNSHERIGNRDYFERDAALLRRKIVQVEEEKSRPPFFSGEKKVRLDDDLYEKLVFGQSRAQKGKGEDALEDIVGKGEFFEIVEPRHTMEDVICPPETGSTLKEVAGQITMGVWETLGRWGINPQPAGEKKSGRCGESATILFHGPPGTGKTHAAMAIAGTLQRKMLTLDCTKVLGKYVGESEQGMKKIFDDYREICSKVKKPPVLLLNEADQFFQKRLSATRSTDRMYNQMQNILLEEMERFSGILIATTNLVDEFDTAFSRRFHYKVLFDRPGVEEREKLWRLHLPETLPLGADVEIKRVSLEFDLSGGQIALAVKNAAVRAAMRGRKKRMLMQADLVRACSEEMKGNFDHAAKRAIGF